MSQLVSYKCLGLNQCIPELGLNYKNVGDLLGGCLTVKNWWGLLKGDDGD
jgi:hypothetical protein